MNKMPISSVRGRVRSWIEANSHRLGDNVLEVGSRRSNPGAWWCDNRDLARGQWLGVDMQAGAGVDAVHHAEDLYRIYPEQFTGVLCSEVLEHVRRPWKALGSLHNTLKPGGWIVITTLTAFPIHGFPDDYWRFTENGLALLLQDAGFREITTASAGSVPFVLNDHGEPGHVRKECPMHVFAVAQRGA